MWDGTTCRFIGLGCLIVCPPGVDVLPPKEGECCGVCAAAAAGVGSGRRGGLATGNGGDAAAGVEFGVSAGVGPTGGVAGENGVNVGAGVGGALGAGLGENAVGANANPGTGIFYLVLDQF